MIEIGTVIARVTDLRAQSAAVGLGSPKTEGNPAFEYGMVCGKDFAFAMVLQEIQELLEKDAESEED